MTDPPALQDAVRVAILHYAGPPYVGGVEKTIAAQARFLADRGHDVRIIAGNGGDLGDGIETLTAPEFGSRGPNVDVVNAELAAGTVGQAYEALVELIVVRLSAWLSDVDVLLAHNVLTMHKNLALTDALARLHERGDLPPLIAWCHDFAWVDPVYDGELHAGRPWTLLRERWSGVQYVVVSTDRQHILADLLDVDPGEIVVVPPGLDLKAFLKLEPETVELIDEHDLLVADPLLLLPARITRRKNIQLAIEITGALRDAGMRPRLLVTGPPGPHNPTNAAYLAELKRSATARGADGDVMFLYEMLPLREGGQAPVSDAMMSDLFRIADALIFPSRAEGFGVPVIEAGLSGLPIFCSDLPVFVELLSETGVVFSPDDTPESIATRIVQALRSDGRNALRRRVRLDHTWQAICEQQLLPLIQAAGRP
jgi:mannosylglucosylglycerate synthase